MKPLAYLDLESTGVDAHKDRIVEIALLRPDLDERLVSLVNPGIPIPKETTEVHGITDEMVADAPGLADLNDKIRRLLEGAIIVGYNSRRFDVPLLDAELQRTAGIGLPKDEHGAIAVPEIDLYEVLCKLEPRDLVTTAKRFAGVDLEESAHRAGADTEVLPEVLKGMAAELLPLPEITEDADGKMAVKDPEKHLEIMMELSWPEDAVDRDGKFKRREDGVIVFNFGKHVDEPAARHPSYLDWMVGADFSPETKAHCHRFLKILKAKGVRW